MNRAAEYLTLARMNEAVGAHEAAGEYRRRAAEEDQIDEERVIIARAFTSEDFVDQAISGDSHAVIGTPMTVNELFDNLDKIKRGLDAKESR